MSGFIFGKVVRQLDYRRCSGSLTGAGEGLGATRRAQRGADDDELRSRGGRKNERVRNIGDRQNPESSALEELSHVREHVRRSIDA
jgi:hypothetical protein